MASKRSLSPISTQAGSSKKPKNHIDIDDFKADLQAAVNKVVPSPQPVFSEALLVTLNWTKCDFNDKAPTNDLVRAFKDVYDIDHEGILLDSNLVWKDVRSELITTMNSIDLKTLPRGGDTSCKLVIIYYGGHAERAASKNDVLIYGEIQNGQRKAPWLSWNEIARMIPELAESRGVVHILDCCNAGMANLDTDFTTMYACAWQSGTSAHVKECFTAALTEQIRAGGGASLSPADLIGFVEKRLRTTPRSSQPFLRAPMDDMGPPIMFHKMNVPAASIAPPPSGTTRPLIIVTVMMVKDLEKSDLVSFKKWLTTNVPERIGTIDIAAKWSTTSTALQFIMPAAVWFALPDNDSETYHYQGLYLGDYECFPLRRLDSSESKPPVFKKENIGLGERSPTRRNVEAGPSSKMD